MTPKEFYEYCKSINCEDLPMKVCRDQFYVFDMWQDRIQVLTNTNTGVANAVMINATENPSRPIFIVNR